MNKCSLSELFPIDDQKAIEDKKINLIFDTHNLVYRCLFSAIFMNPEDNESFFLFRHLFMNSLFNTIKKFNPERVILIFDAKNSWRRDVYNKYKCNRKLNRDKAVVDFEKFFPILDEFKKDLKETFTTIYMLEHSRAEGDDIIAVLCHEQFKTQQNIIVSTDKDMHQLLMKKNNQQYDPIKQTFVTCINPKRELDLKIITGDKGDAIPSIKPKTGIVTAEKILKEGIEDFLNKKENEQCKENYLRNRTLIDFNFIPNDLVKGIINMFNEYKISDIDGSKIMKFFFKNKLNKMMEQWQTYSSLIKSLK
jgi:5'-3' exonuclease